MNPHVDKGGIRGSLARYGKITVYLLFTVVFSLVSAKTTSAEDGIFSAPKVVINEVLANEPGSNTKLEWAEVYIADSVGHDLEGWAFISKDDTTWFPAGTTVPAKGFLILARKLLSDPPDSISFEGWWGDRSGTWGDSPDESFPAIEAKMSLTNSGGTISLLDLESNAQTFTWDEDCGDGVSMERVSFDEDVWLCSVDSDKSTPGGENSVSATYSNRIKLSIEPNPFSPDGDGFEDQAVFRYTLPMESNLTIRIYDVKGRLIRTLIDDEPKVSGEILWEGKDDENRTVRIGIYVVLAEATGDSYSQKKTTVVVTKR